MVFEDVNAGDWAAVRAMLRQLEASKQRDDVGPAADERRQPSTREEQNSAARLP
jgi:hypothetical protein